MSMEKQLRLCQDGQLLKHTLMSHKYIMDFNNVKLNVFVCSGIWPTKQLCKRKILH